MSRPIAAPIAQNPAPGTNISIHRFEDINITWSNMTITSLFMPVRVQAQIVGNLGFVITGQNISISNLTIVPSTVSILAYTSATTLTLSNVTATYLLEVDVIAPTVVTLTNVSGTVYVSNMASPSSDAYIAVTPVFSPLVQVWCMMSFKFQRCWSNATQLYPFGGTTFSREVIRLRPPCPPRSTQKSTTGVYVGIALLVAILVMFITIFIIHRCSKNTKEMID